MKLTSKTGWPRGRWLAVYTQEEYAWVTEDTLAAAKRFVERRLRLKLAEQGATSSPLHIPINAVITRVGSAVAYHGRRDGGRMTWKRVRPV